MTASRSTGAILLLLAPILLATAAHATTHDGKPKILLHTLPVVAKNQCTAGQLASCQDAVTQGMLNTYYDVFVLGARGNLSGLSGLQFGINYQGGVNPNGGESPISVYSWTLCGSLNFKTGDPPWPAPASGILVTFGDYDYGCVTEDVNVAGYFYMGAYAPASLQITPYPVDLQLKASSCAQVETILNAPDDAGYITFSDTGAPGCNPCNAPCVAVAVQPTTWSRIKAQVGP